MKLEQKPKMKVVILAAGAVCLISVALAASGTKISPRSSRASAGNSNDKSRRDAVVSTWGRNALALAAFQAAAQQPATAKPQMAEEVFKNVQVLKGITVDDFMGTMGVMAASLSFCCNECHPGAGTDKVVWEADTPRKRTARRMVTMVAAINKDNFGGRQVVTCWTCHRGKDFPPVTPSIDDDVYGTPRTETEDIVRRTSPQPSADQVLDKYIQALGGAQRLASVNSYVAKGISTGFGGFGGGGDVTISAKAPNQRTTHIQYKPETGRGDVTRSFDGTTAWYAIPLTVIPMYELTGAELDGARLDAQLSFPGQIKQVLSNFRVGDPTVINDKEVNVVQGTGPRGLLATLYFDKQTGLLARVLRYDASPIGRVPTQVDYAEYRDVSGGIKMPFKWTFSWLDGRDTVELKEVQLNVPIDPTVFGKPTPRK
jgi:photosynthetic reaction center cytochrome c subunit